MKFLVCAGYAPSLINFRWSFINAIGRFGNVAATAPEEDDVVKDSFVSAGFSYIPIALSRSGVSIFGDVEYFRSLVALMRKESPDLVFCYTMKPVVFGALAARKAKVPRVYAMLTGLGYVFTEGGGFKKVFIRMVVEFLLKSGLRACDGVFFQNPDDEGEFRRRGLIPKSLPVFQVAGSGIDLEHFGRISVKEPQCERGVQFLLIARMLVDKGIREYVKASQALPEDTCTSLIVGPLDPNPAGLEAEEIESWTNTGQIRYVPGVDDVRPFLADCQVYVLPSYREGTPRTVLEAMATGRPIITTDAPGCRETVPLTEKGKQQKIGGELVMEGENGFLVRVRNAEALEQAMRRFIEEPELIERMGRRSREIAEEKYDVHKVNKVMIEAMGLSSEQSAKRI